MHGRWLKFRPLTAAFCCAFVVAACSSSDPGPNIQGPPTTTQPGSVDNPGSLPAEETLALSQEQIERAESIFRSAPQTLELLGQSSICFDDVVMWMERSADGARIIAGVVMDVELDPPVSTEGFWPVIDFEDSDRPDTYVERAIQNES